MAAAISKELDFHFLHNEKTKQYIKNCQVLFIMRGLPGSGKSTIVLEIVKVYGKSDTCVCSADDYFLQQDGVYKYQREDLHDAHQECQIKAQNACKEKVPIVIIDNTNVRKWEMKFYLTLADTYNYNVILVSPRTEWSCDGKILAQKNKHNVDEDTLKQKIIAYVKENVNPYYWGWFLNINSSNKLVKLAQQYLISCINTSKEFSKYYESQTGKKMT